MNALESQRAYTVAADISFPRLVGSQGEAEARERVKVHFQAAGLVTGEEEFGCSDFAIQVAARWAMAPTGALLLFASLTLYYGIPLLALLLSIASFAPVVYASRKVNTAFHNPEREKKFLCANVVGRLPSEPETGPLVILMAHYDSKSQTFPIWLRILLFIVTAFGSLALMMLIAACAVVGLIGADCALAPLLAYPAAVLFALDLSFLLNRVGNLSDGALDNATGVGIITEIADRINAEGVPVRLRVIATAAEEIGLCGANAYIERHGRELDPKQVRVLNFDGCGSGPFAGVLAAFGIPRKSASPELLAAARKAAKDKGIHLRRYYIPVGMATDLMPFRKAGFEGIDFIGMAGKSHTPADRMDLADAEVLEDYVRIGAAVVRELADTTK